jgi:integrase
MKITKQNLSAIAAAFEQDGKADRIYFDDDLPGFGLRLRKGSRRQTYVVQYERQGWQKRLVIGTTAILDPEEARKLARRELAKVTLGSDPQGEKAQERERARITLKAVAVRYLALKKETLRPNSYKNAEGYLLKSWKPLHAFPVHKIERRKVAAVLGDIPKKVAASRARSTLSALFAWAIAEGYLDVNPVTGTNDPDPRIRRERSLVDAKTGNADELAAVWNACGNDEYGRIIKLLILTGQRRDEIGDMRWSELSRDEGTWELPAERAKNKREHSLTLPALAWEIIGEQRQNDSLFGARGGGYTNWHQSKKALDQRCKLKSPWVIHDLRRSVATGMATIGIQPHIIEAVLNHISGHKAGVAGVYNRSSYDDEKKAALVRWTRYVTLVIDPDLLAAHEAYLARGDDNSRNKASAVFRKAIAEGGALWDQYLRVIATGEERKILPFPAETG